jgi:hypothetical protein
LAPCHCPESSLQHPSQGLRYSPPAQLSTRKHSDVINAQKWWPVDLLCGGGKKTRIPEKILFSTHTLYTISVNDHTSPYTLNSTSSSRFKVGSRWFLLHNHHPSVCQSRPSSSWDSTRRPWGSLVITNRAKWGAFTSIADAWPSPSGCYILLVGEKTLVTELKRFCQVPSSSRGLESLVVMKWGAISTSPYDMFRWL